ncbi:hypothetical protein NE237_030601 [Protea cynaroides]|uniref:Uncharacterized protein n=1 Tax=Protea cynaroides TaxID=273540 RepID=A0A9Q0GY62_9MAGN|nr:hypothetical protein NE237_030601 [Protea cynaroides]
MMSLCSAKDMSSLASSSTDFFKRLEGSDRVEGTCNVTANAEGEAVKKPTVTVTEENLKEEQSKDEEELWSKESCCTPRAKECRIPDVLTCPPAPRKQRASYSSPLPLNMKETEEEFFSPPNLESIFAPGNVYEVKLKH